MINPSSATALYGRGVVKRTIGDARGGAQDMDTAKAMRPNVATELARRGLKPPE